MLLQSLLKKIYYFCFFLERCFPKFLHLILPIGKKAWYQWKIFVLDLFCILEGSLYPVDFFLSVALIACWRNYEYQCHFFSSANLYLQLDCGLGLEIDADCFVISASRTITFFKSLRTFIRIWLLFGYLDDDDQDNWVSFCHDAGHVKIESDSDRDQGVGQGHPSEWQVSS